MSIDSGTRLGRYEISSQLGAGGMGEVYLAHDVHLKRPVALKTLPTRFTDSEDRLHRFEREASAASALNHPNIITIHEIGHQDGMHFIAMEFVDGETLRSRLSRTEMSLKETLDVAVQVAEALAAAHEAGIVHRDIKPENIMIRRDGYVKVLDFGLAKLTERRPTFDSQAETIAKADTDPGTVLGTMQYMSPEQARGLEVDQRTDTWSLGVVLYEMVTGRTPFEAETTSDVIVAVLSQEPAALSQQVGAVPAELERIVRKALQKRKDERYQTVKDMALDLKSLRRDLEVGVELERSIQPRLSSSGRTVVSGANRSATTFKGSREDTGHWEVARSTSSGGSLIRRLRDSRRVALVLGVLIVAAGLAFGLFKFFGQSKSPGESVGLFKQTQVTRLTTNGNTRIAAISPDGKYVAYVISEAGKQSMWLRQVAISSNVRLISPSEAEYYGCVFSGDGNFIYYAMESPGNPPAIYKLPVLGGSPTKAIGDLTGPATLSPDGKQMAIVDVNREELEVTLSIANLDGTGKRKLFSRKSPEFFDWVAWSPDGKSIVCPVRGVTGANPIVSIIEIQVGDGSTKIISSQQWLNNSQVVWLADKSGLLVIAQHKSSSFMQIWQVSYPDGVAQSITNDLTDYRGVSVSDDSKALVSVQSQRFSNVWLSKSAKNLTDVTQITPGVGAYYDLAWTPDGRILYASDASGSADIWEMEVNGTNQKQLTAGAERNYAPSASPDGRFIVFHSNRSGTWQIWRMDRDGSNPRQITFDNHDSNWPEVSPDTRWIVYHRMDSSQTMTLWKVGIDGGTPIRLTDDLALRPAISPDGKWIAYWTYGDKTRIGVIPFAGGPSVKIFDVSTTAVAGWDAVLKWTPDGSALTYLDRRSGIHNVWGQPFGGGEPTKLTDFKDNQFFSFTWLPDGRLLSSRGFWAGDAVLIRDSR